jgi:hypothetical protein
MRNLSLLAVVVLSLVRLDAAPVVAHDASPAASPRAADCVAPPKSPGIPTTRIASPAAVDPSPTPYGLPVDQALVDRLIAAERNLTNCLNAGAYDVVIALHAPEALPTLFGTADPEDAAARLAGFPSVETLALRYVQVLSDGRFTIEATFTAGDGVMRRRDYWVERDGVLLYDGYDVLPLEAATPRP